ncbi:MAG: DUF3326 domain-containing protein [Synechococcaceae cyanobacterium]
MSGATPPLPTLLVIPTGVGCEQGGYAGDGLPVARLLAAASGCLVTHPNALNAAVLGWSDRRIHYVEGWSLDRFAAGELALRPVAGRRVGLLLDAGIDPELRQRQLQAAEACRASLGLAIGPVLISEAPFGVSLSLGPSGSSWGSLANPEALLRGGRALRDRGAEAIAVVARFPEDPHSPALAAYRQGSGVDALAGAEAVISHLLSRELGIPCAHAPALAPLPLDPQLDPRAAAEELGYTFLPCVLIGLSRAPDLVPLVAEPLVARDAFRHRDDPGDAGEWAAPSAQTSAERNSAQRTSAERTAAERTCVDWTSTERTSAERTSAERTFAKCRSAAAAPGMGNTPLLRASDLGAVVAPAGALGGEAVLACAARGVPLIAVASNRCLLQVDGAALGLKVLEAASYAEAAGLVLALREGLDPACLRRPLARLQVEQLRVERLMVEQLAAEQ